MLRFDFRLNQKTVVAVRLALKSEAHFRAVVWIDDPIFVFNKVRGTLVFLVSLSGTLRKTETVRTQYLDASWL